MNIPEYSGAGVYSIRNINTGIRYIGVAVNVRRRLKTHFSELRRGNGINNLIQSDFNNGNSFECEILCKIADPSPETMIMRERQYIAKYSVSGLYNIRDPNRDQKILTSNLLRSGVAKVYDEIRIRLPKGDKATIQAHASARGESINGYISKAIAERMERENDNITAREDKSE